MNAAKDITSVKMNNLFKKLFRHIFFLFYTNPLQRLLSLVIGSDAGPISQIYNETTGTTEPAG